MTNAQSYNNFSTSSCYSRSYGANDHLESWYRDYYGNYCEIRVYMVWTKHYGQQQVQVWDNYSGRFYYEYAYNYYYTYRWHRYNTCQ